MGEEGLLEGEVMSATAQGMMGGCVAQGRGPWGVTRILGARVSSKRGLLRADMAGLGAGGINIV
jgi:hypothetical protein